MSDGEWRDGQQWAYGDQPEQPSSSGRGRRRSGGGPGDSGYGAPVNDPYAVPQQGYAPQPQDYPLPQQPEHPQQGYPQAQQGYDAQGYAQQGYDQGGYAPEPPAAAVSGSGSGGGYGRRAARSGPKVVQSEVLDSRDASGYGYEPQGQYAPEQDSYGQAPVQDDGWGSTSGTDYDSGYAAYEQPVGNGRGADGDWDPRDSGGWDDRDGYGDDGYDDELPPPRRSKLRAWAPLVFLLAIASLMGGCIYGGYNMIKSKGAPKDYASNTCASTDKNKVPVEVGSGDSQTVVGDTLFAAGVVASSKAYIAAANNDQSSQRIQQGLYNVCKNISGATAVRELLKSSNRVDASRLVVTPDMRKSEAYKYLVADLNTLGGAKLPKKYTADDLAAAEKSGKIDLPDWAKNNVEGFLEPGTYELSTKDNPTTVLKAIVDKRLAFLKSINFEAAAKQLNCGPVKCTPYQALIIASMAQAEISTGADAAKVSEAVSLRLHDGGSLDIDATTLYGLNVRGRGPTSAEQADANNLYNTSTASGHKGLSVIPGPVGNPTDDIIQGILKPTGGGWYYWCAVGGNTKFYPKSQLAQQQKDCQVGTTATTTKKP